jgi:DNA polymerase-3 subunit delta'
MAFADFTTQTQGVALLQRSLERGRLGHAYLFTGHELTELEALARTLAKTLNCENPRVVGYQAVDCCDECRACGQINHDVHPDVFWVRPESKTRVIKIDQITRREKSPPRVLLDVVTMKPTEGDYKVCIVSAADRMNEAAANSFLKTLEEPPANCVLILLSAEPQRLLDTILSRCLRLKFEAGGKKLDATRLEWLQEFGEVAAQPQKSLLGRYCLLDALVSRLTKMKEEIETTLTEKSPGEKYDDVEKSLSDQWEKELTGAIESEYRLQRGEYLGALQTWLRDVWLRTLAVDDALLLLPQLASTAAVARRISTAQAMENLRVLEQTQRLLHTNVQEALALEVGLLKLQL